MIIYEGVYYHMLIDPTMSHQSLDQLILRMKKTFEVNFAKPYALEAHVKEVMADKSAFLVETNDGKHVLECQTKEDLSQLKEGDDVRMKAMVRSSHKTGRIFLDVEYFYTIDQQDLYEEKIEVYHRLKQVLMKERCQNIILDHHQVKRPRYIINIGLITLPGNDKSLEEFKNLFQEKCTGTLFIYHLQGKIENDFRTALEYFHKYHQIDLVCILSNQLSVNHILQLSSKNNIIYLLNRKKFPYILSVIDVNSQMKSLSAILSNYLTVNVIDAVDFIHSIQETFKKEINENIELCMQQLRQIITAYQNKILNCELLINKLNDPRFSTSSSPFEQLRSLIIKKLDQERLTLNHIENLVMHRIIEDPTFKQIYTEVMEAQRKKIENKTGSNNVSSLD